MGDDKCGLESVVNLIICVFLLSPALHNLDQKENLNYF